MAEIISPNYVSQFGNGGEENTSPACQYLVVVSKARLGGGVCIYQLQNPIAFQGNPDFVLVGSGPINGMSVQPDLPEFAGTFTLSTVEP